MTKKAQPRTTHALKTTTHIHIDGSRIVLTSRNWKAGKMLSKSVVLPKRFTERMLFTALRLNETALNQAIAAI